MSVEPTIKMAAGYRKGIRPAMPQSFPQFVDDELIKIAYAFANYEAIISSLEARIAVLEGP